MAQVDGHLSPQNQNWLDRRKPVTRGISNHMFYTPFLGMHVLSCMFYSLKGIVS